MLEKSMDWLQDRWEVDDVVLSSGNATWIIFLAAVLILGITLYPPVWRVLRFSPTVIHEMGHVLVAKLTFRKVHGIRVETDASGVTVSSGRSRRSIGTLLTTLAGYPAPAAMATGMALLLHHGYAGAALTIYHFVIIIATLLCRNVWGVVSCLITFVLTIGVTIWNDPTATSVTVIALIIFYSVTGVRGSLGLFQVHFAHLWVSVPPEIEEQMRENSKGSDASGAWRQVLIIPPAVWVIIFIVVNIILTFYSLYLLVTV